MKNALTRAREHAEKMQDAMLWTTIQSVVALLVLLVILLAAVSGLRVRLYFLLLHDFYISIFFKAPIAREPENPCIPSPCGPNSQCRVIGVQAACSCLPNYIGQPPGCRPECTINAECSSSLACINERCKDPCPGSCGDNARCSITNHNAICTCEFGYEGDPSTHCRPIPPPRKKFIILLKTNWEFLSILLSFPI